MIDKKLDELLGEERFEALEVLVKKAVPMKVSKEECKLLFDAYLEEIKDKVPEQAYDSVAYIYLLINNHYRKHGK